MSTVLVVLEHDRGSLADASLEALTAGRGLAGQLGVGMAAVALGGSAAMAGVAGSYGAATIHVVDHEFLADYGPEAWGESLAQLVQFLQPAAVIATGTDRGNEVMAQAAARLDLPMVANVLEARPSSMAGSLWALTRVRWGGSLLESTSLTSATPMLTFSHHAVIAEPIAAPGLAGVETFVPSLDAAHARTNVRDRVERPAGVTLATARIIVSGGRGVGSAENFAPLTELATTVGGVVGCSRAVTNNGWRPHSDQVGQTGTRVAPDLYIACGISGAIQHWVGAMASKKVLAINTDPEANMVTKADYAVIGDLHKVVPAVTAEILRRRG